MIDNGQEVIVEILTDWGGGAFARRTPPYGNITYM